MNLNLPHRRYNPLLDSWVLVSPQRTARPWQGLVDEPAETAPHEHDPDCYLCTGNVRSSGEINPEYVHTFVFDNDFPAIVSQPGADPLESIHGLIRAEPVTGVCRVICFSPRHDLTMADMSAADIGRVIATWREQYLALSRSNRWVQIFENKGEMMGCSSPHPHGQIWASDHLPTEPASVDRHQLEYFTANGSRLLSDYVAWELLQQERIVDSNDDWVVLVPWWASWPFQTMVLPKIPISHMGELSPVQQESLAVVLKQHLVRYDRLFETSFPYSMGWHQAPGKQADTRHWQMHAHFYPPLLRSASVRKHMVGYELLADPQRDITPEEAAARLREI